MPQTGEIRPIDVRHLGRERVICCWQVGDVLVDPGPASCLPTLLEALGDARPRALLLTHVHLDHAGAAGSLVRRWPDLEVYVHERGAPHLVDPERLWASASRLYDDMEGLWGEMLPVPEERLRVLRGGERLPGGFRAAYTPGHASHHVAYLHEPSGQAFVGDAAGVRIPPAGFTLAPTPPPDVDLEAWSESLDRIEEWRPSSLGLTHFGEWQDVAEHIDALRTRMAAWAALAQHHGEEPFAAAIHAEIAGAVDADTAAVYEQAAPATQLWMGLDRYWRKRAQQPPVQRSA